MVDASLFKATEWSPFSLKSLEGGLLPRLVSYFLSKVVADRLRLVSPVDVIYFEQLERRKSSKSINFSN